MGAIALAEPVEVLPARRRYAVPALLAVGWGALLAYSAAYLTEDVPLRPPAGQATAPDDVPRRVVVIAAAEPAPRADQPPAAPAKPVAAPAVAVAQPAPSAAPAPARPTPVSAEYVGVWGPTPAACRAPSRRRGYLPAVITADRAEAGRTACRFHDGRRVGPAWVMAAACSDRGRRWTSQVRLVRDGDRLTWSSGRGTADYVRCRHAG